MYYKLIPIELHNYYYKTSVQLLPPLCINSLSLSLPPPLPPLSFSHSLSPSLQLIGLALIGFGIYLLVGDNTLRVLTGNEFASDGALILVAGVITAIISFVGILGAAGKWPVVLGFVS